VNFKKAEKILLEKKLRMNYVKEINS